MNIDIYMRKDLKMRKGKMAAQASHAINKLILCMFSWEGEQLIMNRKFTSLFNRWFQEGMSINLKMVEDNETFTKEYDYWMTDGAICELVVDAGRTEFKGQLTPTCFAVHKDWPMPHGGSQSLLNRRNLEKMVGEPDNTTKQMLIYNSDATLTKEEFVCEAARASVSILMDHMCPDLEGGDTYILALTEGDPMLHWLAEAFTKITVRSDEFETLKMNLALNGLKFQSPLKSDKNAFIATYPYRAEDINPLTQHLKLM